MFNIRTAVTFNCSKCKGGKNQLYFCFSLFQVVLLLRICSKKVIFLFCFVQEFSFKKSWGHLQTLKFYDIILVNNKHIQEICSHIKLFQIYLTQIFYVLVVSFRVPWDWKIIQKEVKKHTYEKSRSSLLWGCLFCYVLRGIKIRLFRHYLCSVSLQ